MTQVSAQISGSDSECWFCRSTTDRTPLEVKLYRIVRRENKYAVVAIKCETSYETKAVDVPRCPNCADSHDRFGNISLIPTTGIVLTIIGLGFYPAWQWIQNGEANAVTILGLGVGLIFFSYLGVIGIGLLWSLVEVVAERCGYNTGRRSQQYPLIISLQSQGWVVGDKPPYKGDDIKG